MNHFLILLIGSLFLGILGAGCGSQSGGGVQQQVNAGKAGSTARFSIHRDHLYTLAGEQILVFDVSQAEQPEYLNKVLIAPDVETIFAYEEQLFLGAETGMYIFDIHDPGYPFLVGEHIHQRACDPVVVQGDLAYVTLRSGGLCGGGRNVLQVIDISSPSSPILLKSYRMTAPAGLGVDGNNLFVCDGYAGLKVFDLEDPINLSLKEVVYAQYCNDVIPNNGVLVVSSKWGIFQYSYEQEYLHLLSVISWK